MLDRVQDARPVRFVKGVVKPHQTASRICKIGLHQWDFGLVPSSLVHAQNVHPNKSTATHNSGRLQYLVQRGFVTDRNVPVDAVLPTIDLLHRTLNV